MAIDTQGFVQGDREKTPAVRRGLTSMVTWDLQRSTKPSLRTRPGVALTLATAARPARQWPSTQSVQRTRRRVEGYWFLPKFDVGRRLGWLLRG